MIELVDTHCHIHEVSAGESGDNQVHSRWEAGGVSDPDELIRAARTEGVKKFICVGTTLEDSELASRFVEKRPGTWASLGIHPHESKAFIGDQSKLRNFRNLLEKPKVVAIGECGLDYFYTHSPREIQLEVLEQQLEIAQKHKLPVIFHVREAFDDFWPLFDNFTGLKGVLHSFTATTTVLDQALLRGLFIGLNGIMTFTKDEAQRAMAKAVPLQKLVLETDAPFLTPHPLRGKICEPKHVRVTAEFLANLRGESLDELAQNTTDNAEALFNLKD